MPWWHIRWPHLEAWTATARRYQTHGWELKMYAICIAWYVWHGTVIEEEAQVA